LPLESLIGHIDSLTSQICELESELARISFSRIRRLLKSATGNYKNGLKIIREGLTECLIKKAELVAQNRTKDGRLLSPEQVVYTVYQEYVSASYVIAERFNTEITMLVRCGIPPELYHWLLQIPEHFGVEKIIVLQEGPRFITETFNQKIIVPLKSMIELAKRPEVEGTLAQLKPIDLTESNPIEDGYVVSCVRGEAQNPVLWPILCHEMFELVDMDQHLLQDFGSFVSKKGESLPILNSDAETNLRWILEILMDFLAINSFGPMYAKSLLEYFKRAPYYQTFEHPEMSSRLFSVYQYLIRPKKSETDILGKCQLKAKEEIEPEIHRYEIEEELDPEKEQKLLSLYSLLEQFFETIKVPSFIDKLARYSDQAANPKATLKEILQARDDEFIPFQDPLFDFNDIKNNILYHHISLATDPDIVLNVVLANLDLYQKHEHLSVIVDSIRKWKIKQIWNYSIDTLSKNS